LKVLIPIGNVSHGDHGFGYFLGAFDVGEDGDVQNNEFFDAVGNQKGHFLGYDAAPVMAGQEKFIDPEGVDDLDHIFGQFHFLIGFDVQGAFAVAKAAQIRCNHTEFWIEKGCYTFPAIRAFRPSMQHHNGKSILVPPVPDIECSPGYGLFFLSSKSSDVSFRAFRFYTTSVGCIKWMSGRCQALFQASEAQRAKLSFCFLKQIVTLPAHGSRWRRAKQFEKDLDKNGASH